VTSRWCSVIGFKLELIDGQVRFDLGFEAELVDGQVRLDLGFELVDGQVRLDLGFKAEFVVPPTNLTEGFGIPKLSENVSNAGTYSQYWRDLIMSSTSVL
jgi:hypothetical protein